MKTTISLTMDEANIFDSFIQSKRETYSGYSAGSESPAEYEVWSHAANQLGLLHASIIRRFELIPLRGQLDIMITREEAAVFHSMIVEKIGVYSGYADGSTTEEDYQEWSDAVSSLVTLESRLVLRLEEEADK